MYANRAAAHKRIGNIRSALKDCILAKKLDSFHKKVFNYLNKKKHIKNFKAILRGAECLLELGYSQQCIDWIDSSTKGLIDANVSDVSNLRIFDELRAKARRSLAKEERDARKQRLSVFFIIYLIYLFLFSINLQ